MILRRLGALRAGLVLAVLAPCVFGEEEDAGLDSLQGMIEKTVPLRTHSIAPPYVDSDLQNRWWDFGADTIINTNKHIRLTQDKPSQTGWLWSRMPLGVSNWQMDVEFKVDGKTHNVYGDGFAIWVAKDRAKSDQYLAVSTTSADLVSSSIPMPTLATRTRGLG